MASADPLIVTLTLDPASTDRFNALRREHFPPRRNVLDAHLTLFHHLPGDRIDEVKQQLDDACETTPPLQLTAVGPFSLGKGVAIRIAGDGLKPLRASLLDTFLEHFPDDVTRQDRGGFRPHVTVQNKVSPEEARALLASLESTWAEIPVSGDGLSLWWYRGGPWEPAGRFAFRGRTDRRG